MKDIKIIISSLLILISFFLWYSLSERKKDLSKTEKQNYVNIEILKTKIKISKDTNTKVTINWDIVKNEIYDIK
jgi:hypothetical protein